MIENNIVAVRSAGEECFVCERQIPKGAPAIQVTFRVTFVVKVSKTVEAHAEPCARELSGLIDLRVRQAMRLVERGGVP